MPIESNETSLKLNDRTALISGPCNATIQAIASKFTQMGANVALIDRNVDKLQRFANQLTDAREINERYGRAAAIPVDLNQPRGAQDAISRVAESFGSIDIYVDGHMLTDAKRFDDAETLNSFDRIMDINLRSPLAMTHGVLRFLKSRKRGRIIYLLQDATRLGFPANGLMAATRNGLSAFARTLSNEMADSNITVNCVALGINEDFLLAQMGAQEASKTSIQEMQQRVQQTFPQARITEPERAANMIAFLASPLGVGITGQTIAVSQGLSFLS